MSTNDQIFKFFKFRSRRDNLPMLPTKTFNGKPAVRDQFGFLLAQLNFTEAVEVGTRHGEFAMTLCKGHPGLHLTCVDPWMAYTKDWTQERQDRCYANAVQNLAPFNVTIVRKPSLDAVQDFADKSLDFVYIDGDHTFDMAVQDIIQWMHKLKTGGIMAVHDYYHFYKAGVVAAVNSYTHCHHIDPWFTTREQLPTAFWVKP